MKFGRVGWGWTKNDDVIGIGRTLWGDHGGSDIGGMEGCIVSVVLVVVLVILRRYIIDPGVVVGW